MENVWAYGAWLCASCSLSAADLRLKRHYWKISQRFHYKSSHMLCYRPPFFLSSYLPYSVAFVKWIKRFEILGRSFFQLWCTTLRNIQIVANLDWLSLVVVLPLPPYFTLSSVVIIIIIILWLFGKLPSYWSGIYCLKMCAM